MLKRKRTIYRLYGIGTKGRLFVRRHAVLTSLTAFAIPVATLLLLVTPTHAANGLIGAWKLDEGNGTTATDSSGNGINGTIVRGTGTGSPAWVSPGHDGSTANALDFDGSGSPGTASNSVDLGTDSRLDQMDHYTISLWVKFKTGYVGNSGAWANLVGRNSSAGNWAWMIYVNSSGTIRPHHRNSDGSFAPLTNSATVMPIGQWVHIEQVADGSHLHLYINGKEDPNFPITYSGTTMSLPTAHTYIGQDKREYAPLATISDVKIYNDASLPPQVATSAATNVTQSSANLNGTVTTLGDFSTASVFFRYRVAGSSGSYTETPVQTINATGPFSANISGLSGSTQYEFKPVVQWQGRDGTQEITGQLLTFKTPAYGVITQVVDNLTSEDGDTGSFSVCLSVRPSAAVTIALSSSNNGEGTVPASVTIQPDDWNKCDTNLVTVTGVDDSPPVGDGAVPYTIVTGEVTSADANFNALTGSDVADIGMVNQNNDPPGIVVSTSGNTTTEASGTVRAQFRLLSQPTADVTIPLSLSDTSEATLGGVTSITITPANWDQPQNNEVVITGVDDDLTDGDVTYTLQTGAPTSADAGYSALGASDIADTLLVNQDNDTAGVTVSETGGSTNVMEGGSTDSFTVVLNSQPASGNVVVVDLQPDSQVDLGNGPGVATQLTFTNANWNVPQSVIVAATDDTAIEGAHTGLIATSIDPSTTESSYLSVDPADVTAHITDNDDDNDGIAAAVEDAGPNGGDANNDGILDSRQPQVSTLVDPVTSDYVSIAAAGCTDGNSNAGAVASSSLAAKDADYSYPAGLVNFSLDCAASGDSATVTLYFFGVDPSGMVLRKYNPTTHAYNTVSGATITSVTIGGQQAAKATYSIADGGTLDTDGTANGAIVDPAGLATTTITATGTTGNTSATAPDTGHGAPTNSHRGIKLLITASAIFLLAGFGILYRQRKTSNR
jgi:hypothetical protein